MLPRIWRYQQLRASYHLKPAAVAILLAAVTLASAAVATASPTNALAAAPVAAAGCAASWDSPEQLPALLADPRVACFQMTRSMLLDASAWSNVNTPQQITRDVTIAAPADAIGSVLLDFNAVSRKVALQPGVTLRLRGIVLRNTRSSMTSRAAPGWDLMDSSAAPPEGVPMARLLLEDSALLLRLCNPPAFAAASHLRIQRPPEAPGAQQYTLSIPQDGCVNATGSSSSSSSSAVPSFLQRCWADRYEYEDVAMAGLTPRVLGGTQPANYVVHILRSATLCERVLSQECIDRLGVLDCTLYEASRLPPEPSLDQAGPPPLWPAPTNQPPPQQVQPGQKEGSSSSSGSGSAAVVVPAIVGGACGAVVLLAAMGILARRWHTTRMRRGDVIGSDKAEGNPDDLASRDLHDKGADNVEALSSQAAQLRTQRSPPVSSACGASCISPVGLGSAPADPRVTVAYDKATSPADAAGSGGGAAGASAACVTTAAMGMPAPAADGGAPFALDSALFTTVSRQTRQSATIPLDLVWGVDVLMDRNRLLGTGGFGRVLEGKMHGRPVAVKVLHRAPTPRAARQPAAAAAAGGGPGAAAAAAADGDRELGRECDEQHGAGDEEQRGGAAVIDASRRTHLAQRSGVESGNPIGDYMPCDDMEKADNVTSAVMAGAGYGDSVEAQAASAVGSSLLLSGEGGGLAAEVHIMSRCRHRNVVQLLGACTTPPYECLVLELMERSLASRLQEAAGAGQLLPLDEALRIALDIALGLAYLHPTITHRDLKPANVLLDTAGTAKLGDFGLARLRSTVRETRTPEAGTAPYTAPECFEPDNYLVTHKADIYSWGVVVWEMLTGCAPWAGLRPMNIAFAVTFGRKRLPLHSLGRARCPSRLRALLQECWDADPPRRPSAHEIAKRLVLEQHAQDRRRGRSERDALPAAESLSLGLPLAQQEPAADAAAATCSGAFSEQGAD